MNPTVKISVIIPVYNAKKYLRACLESHINQTLREIEIILVLDCPTDGSDKIAEEYARKDDRIKLIYNNKNLNIGFSRNKGLDEAQGEYIVFSDHDDWRDADMLEKLYNKGKTNQAEIVIGSFKWHDNDRVITRDDFSKDFSKENLLSYFIGDITRNPEWKYVTRVGAIWHIAFSRSFLLKYDLHFEDNQIIYSEDCLFLLQVLLHVEKVSTESSVYYHWRIHNSNTSKQINYVASKKVLNYLIKFHHILLTYDPQYESHRLRFAHTCIWRLYMDVFQQKRKAEGMFSALRTLQTLKKQEDLKDIIQGVPISWAFCKGLKFTKSLFFILLRY